MTTTPQFLTTRRAEAAAAAPADAAPTPPSPDNPNDRYLVSLLESKRALRIAMDTLTARTAYADSTETQYIHVEQGMIDADRLKLSSMVTAYLSEQAVYKPVSAEDLAGIRAIIDDLAGFSAMVTKAADIVAAVTRLLRKWE
jgi:hypothetical protein